LSTSSPENGDRIDVKPVLALRFSFSSGFKFFLENSEIEKFLSGSRRTT
jgi:hypothetical protein